MRSYSEGYDEVGEPRTILPRRSLRQEEEVSTVLDRPIEERFAAEAAACIEKDYEIECRHERELKAALDVLRGILEDGGRGFDADKIIAIAKFAKHYR